MSGSQLSALGWGVHQERLGLRDVRLPLPR